MMASENRVSGTELVSAVQSLDVPRVRSLLDAGADPQTKTRWGRSLLTEIANFRRALERLVLNSVAALEDLEEELAKAAAIFQLLQCAGGKP